jgi:MFS family permease
MREVSGTAPESELLTADPLAPADALAPADPLAPAPAPDGAPALATPATPLRNSSLWRHRDYMKIWSASTVSLMGSQVSQIAIPYIAAVVLHAAAFQVALLGGLEMLPFILFALPAGAWLDRVRRRPVLIAGDLGRAAALITIPIAYAFGVLTVWQLYAVGFVAGTLTVFFDVADQSYLPVLLEEDELVDGNAKLQISASAAQVFGPGLGGGLIGLVAAPFAVIVDAVSFVASGGLISLIRKNESKPERKIAADGSRTSLRQEIAEGLRYVIGNRYLRMIAGCTGTSNLGSSIAFSIFPIFAYVQLGLSAGLIGLASGLGALGVLLGAFISAPLSRRLGVGPVILASIFVSGGAMFFIAAMPSDPLTAGILMTAAMFLTSVSAVVYNVNQVSFRQAITPLDIQGRMNATMRFIVWGTMPVGFLIGGILGSFLPLRTAILIGAVVSATAFLWIVASPVRSLREIPKGARAGVSAE